MALSLDEVTAGLAEIIAEEVDIDAAAVTGDQVLLTDLDIDSLSRLTIATQAEDQFHVTIPDEEINKFVTVGDLANFIVAAQN
jgi:acyl carrier protein